MDCHAVCDLNIERDAHRTVRNSPYVPHFKVGKDLCEGANTWPRRGGSELALRSGPLVESAG